MKKSNKEFMPAWGYLVIGAFVAILLIGFCMLSGHPLSACGIAFGAITVWQFKPLVITLKGLQRTMRVREQTAAAAPPPPPTKGIFRWINTGPGCIVVISVAFWCFCGILVNQPIGVLPDGFTLIYYRQGLNLPFITSADGIQEATTGKVSLFGRGVVLSAMAQAVENRKIITLPYSHTIYLWSTGGNEYDR